MAIPSDPSDALKFDIENFSGGLRRNVDPSKLANEEYPLLVNMRSRYGTLKPIKKPSKIAGFPSNGFYQGCYAQGSLVLVFVNGKAYLCDYAKEHPTYRLLSRLDMSETSEYIFAEAVPNSYMNFGRTTEVNTNDVNKTTTFSSPSPACIVCQDGEKTYLIFSTGGVREAKKFKDWTLEDREYVPVGRNMLYHDGILYIVSPDKKMIYRSVSGRALDFVIAVNQNGDKLGDNLFQEEAERMALLVNNSEITCLSKLNVSPAHPDFGSPFLVGTKIGSFKVEPILTSLLFGEPTYRNTPAFPTAPLNQASLTFSRGDLHFIDETGLRSLNLTETTGVVSKDDAVSASIFSLFEGVEQTTTAIAFFDNYTFYAVKTIYGTSVVIFDNLRGVFESIDIFPELTSEIKMFCQTNINGVKTLFFCTSDGMYQYYGSTETADWKFYSKEFSTDDAQMHHKVLRSRVVIQDIVKDGTISATIYADRQKEVTLTRTLKANKSVETLPIALPFGNSTKDTTVNVVFVPQKSKQSDKIGLLIEGNFDGEIVSVHLRTEQIEAKVPLEQAALVYSK